MQGLYSFGKSEKITEKKLIDELFKPAVFFKAYPLRVHVLPCPVATWSIPIKILIAVPKRNLRKSTQRNYQKRVLRELYRQHKNQLLPHVKTPHALAIIYSDKQNLGPAALQKSWDKLLVQLIDYFKSC